MSYYDYEFESDAGYQQQLNLVRQYCADIEINRKQTDEYLRTSFHDLDELVIYRPNSDISDLSSEPESLDDQRCLPTTERPAITYRNDMDDAHYPHILKNLKQRIANVIKERNARFKLKRQVAIMDAVNPTLDADPLKVLSIVGYKAVLDNDEHNIPRLAKRLTNDSYEERYRAKRSQLAEAFCLMDISRGVMQSCDKYTERKRAGSKPLYLL